MSVNQAGGFFKGRPTSRTRTCSFTSIRCRTGFRNQPRESRARAVSRLPARVQSVPSDEPRLDRDCVESADDAALIRSNYLTTQKDIDEVIQGSRLIRSIMPAPALRAMTVRKPRRGVSVPDARRHPAVFPRATGSIYHLCGSCAMGDRTAHRRGRCALARAWHRGLRIVDASIFPNVTSGNINAPMMMVAEKGAQMILEDAAVKAYRPAAAEMAAAA